MNIYMRVFYFLTTKYFPLVKTALSITQYYSGSVLFTLNIHSLSTVQPTTVGQIMSLPYCYWVSHPLFISHSRNPSSLCPVLCKGTPKTPNINSITTLCSLRPSSSQWNEINLYQIDCWPFAEESRCHLSWRITVTFSRVFLIRQHEGRKQTTWSRSNETTSLVPTHSVKVFESHRMRLLQLKFPDFFHK